MLRNIVTYLMDHKLWYSNREQYSDDCSLLRKSRAKTGNTSIWFRAKDVGEINVG